MAQIPDLRVCDPMRPGITADTVAIPDMIETLKGFNEEWGRFEQDMDPARLKELISICKNGEMLWRCLATRVSQIRSAMRQEKFDAMERKLEELNAKKAAMMFHTVKEEEAIWGGVKAAETQRWVEKRLSLLQKRINNRKAWAEASGASKTD